ncbi:hypothetical protein C1H46_035626 [Malus baccata]|uniref:H/ACA ribonucleoprotein complex subunit n=1 Tax=Malus baccata TaxID=106549 RepID=A0A540KX72_MALBA|nr:hypothetical protein C1H46_035626 [Malus baccata]
MKSPRQTCLNPKAISLIDCIGGRNQHSQSSSSSFLKHPNIMRPPRGGGSFRGSRGRSGGGGGRGFNRGGGRGFFRDEGPPSEVVEVSTFVHACEGEAVTKLTNPKIPHFNAAIYLQNKTQIGKVDEIFGPINESYFSVKVMEGIVATSYSQGDKFYIDPMKLLPLERFLPQPKGQKPAFSRGGGRGRGAPRGRGFPRGGGFTRGRGPPRGGNRGGFRGRGRF